MKNTVLLFLISLLAPGLCSYAAVTVSTTADLVSAVADANAGGDTTILLNDGTYILDSMLWISADHVTIRSVSRNRNAVIIEGRGGMSGGVSHIFNVPGSYFTAEDMTLRGVANHLVQIHGNNGASYPILRNLVLQDAYEQLVKISYESGNPASSSGGLVEGCIFEYTAGIGPQWYIGGVDGHQCIDWVVRENTFRDIQSPESDLAEHAIHFWSGSQGTLVEQNHIINCDRGIGFGLGDRGHQAGIIRNNMIYHDSDDFNADVGIGLESCVGTHVYNNTVFMESSYQAAIEYRFEATSGVIIENNLCNKTIWERNGATGTVRNNVLDAVGSWFANASIGDLHLSSEITSVVDTGIDIPGCTDDFDGDPRPSGVAIDIGCDEYGSSPTYPVTVALFLNQSSYAPGDFFILNWSGLVESDSISVDTYLLLDVAGMYWFYPSWSTALDYENMLLEAGVTQGLTVLDFVWPDVPVSGISVRFWTCTMNAGTFNLCSNIDMAETLI